MTPSKGGDHVGTAELEALLDYLRAARGLDFTGYKRASLTRRIRKRMDAVGVGEFDEYRDVLEVDAEEHSRLVDTILINVTRFFRDEPAWDYLARHVVPAIASRPQDQPIRVWSVGCSSGEEPYSLAMVFAEHLGTDEFNDRVKIFATDTDVNALQAGRSAVYTEDRLDPVSAERLERFFEPVPGGYGLRPDVRRRVIFGRHDATRDPPISGLDLLVCRNVLMYLVSDTQRTVLARFHQALRDGGYLFLGKAETIFSHSDLFTPVEAKLRIFTRSPGRAARPAAAGPPSAQAIATDGAIEPAQLLELAMATAPVAQLVIDLSGHLVGANTKALTMFDLTSADLSRPFFDLEVSRQPIQLESLIAQAYSDGEPIKARDVTTTGGDGQVQFLEVIVSPIYDRVGTELGAALTFADVTELGRARADLERSARDLLVANEQLQSANVGLETSNEELQSTNEELETTNEELQSANEELETMNEELQSANDQLEGMNDELLRQTSQIEDGERFLAGILDSLTVGVAVLSRELDIVVWNRAAEDLFGLRADEVKERSFLALDIGLPFDELSPLLHAVATGSGNVGSVVVDATNRLGHHLRCRITVGRLGAGTETDGSVVILLEPLPDGLS